MKSKPDYSALALDLSAKRHLFLTQGQAGLEAAQRTLAASCAADACVVALDDAASWEPKICDALSSAGMETAFYLAGPEVFLWQVSNRLRKAGVENRRIQREAAGSLARRVYCVPCGTVNAEVTTPTHRCTGCGIKLLVREHFSRPLAAYMGVIEEAEFWSA